MFPSLTLPSTNTIGEIGTGAGAASKAIGSVESGISEADMAKYQAQVAENNATTALRNAQWASQQGRTDEEIQGLRNRQQMGAIRTSIAANGIDVNSGSAQQVQQSAREMGMFDALSIRTRAAREAYGYQVQGQNFENEAALHRAEASDALSAGYLGAGTSLLAGATQLSKQHTAWAEAAGNTEGEPEKAVLAGQ